MMIAGNGIRPGVYPVLFTPFTESGEIDYPALDELADFYISSGVGGLFAVCLSGDMFHLTQEERLAVSRHLIERAGERMSIVCGGNFTGGLDNQAAELEAMHHTGVDAAVVILSVLPSRRDLSEQLLRLCGLTKAPLGLYECPAPEHRLMTPEEIARVASTGRFVFMKETSPTPEPTVEKTRKTVGTPLGMYPARLKSTPQALAAGAAGYCGVMANIAPELCMVMCDTNRTDEERKRAYDALVELHDVMEAHHYPISGKYILQRRGLHLTLKCRGAAAKIFTASDREALDRFLEGFCFDIHN